MVMIQDGPQNTGADKPLRISGEPFKVQVGPHPCDHRTTLHGDMIDEDINFIFNCIGASAALIRSPLS